MSTQITTRPAGETGPLPADPAARAAEIERRRAIIREALASLTIEGGDPGPEALAIAERWIDGRIDMPTLRAEIRALNERL